MLIISNTQATLANTCGKAHHYRFVEEIEPKLETMSMALYRGIIGHEALQAYYELLKAGHPVEECKKAAQKVIEDEMSRVMRELPHDFERIKVLANLFRLIDAYAERYRVEPFEVIEVEKVYTSPIEEGLQYGGKIDVLIRYTSGIYRGDYAVMDHKFVYNFKSLDDVEINAQLPKYIRAVKASGIHVSKGVFNQIRYRPLKDPSPDDVYKRTPYKIDVNSSQVIWDEHVDTAQDIAAGKIKPRRVLNEIVCRGCYFKKLCMAEMKNQDTEAIRKLHYQANTYGYLDMSEESYS
jgi:hypothetical protein